MPDYYDPLTVGYEPDPLGANAFDPYQQPKPVEPVALATPQAEPPIQLTPRGAPLAPYYDYATEHGDTAQTYNTYLSELLPRELASLGLTPEQQKATIAEFQKAIPGPTPVKVAVPERTWTEALATDPLTQLAKGGNSLLKGINWFADFLSPADWDKTRAEWLKQNSSELDAFKSANLQAREQNQTTANSQGVMAAVSNAATDPAILTGMIIESLPSMAIPSGAAGRAGAFALQKALASGMSKEAAESVAKAVAVRWAMLGEGAVATGQVGSDIDTALDKAGITDSAERAKWQAAALPAGVITAALGRFSPVEASLFTSKLLTQGVPAKLIPAMVKHGTKEAIEEYLQSGNEGYWTNVGSKQLKLTDPKAWDGVAVDAALGALAGAATGAGLGGAGRQIRNATAKVEEARKQVDADVEAIQDKTLNEVLNDTIKDSIEPAAVSDTQQTTGAQDEESQPIREVDEGQSNGQETQNQGGVEEGRSNGQDEIQNPEQVQKEIEQAAALLVPDAQTAAAAAQVDPALLEDIQVSEDPTLTQINANNILTRLQDAVQSNPNAAQAAAFVAAEQASTTASASAAKQGLRRAKQNQRNTSDPSRVGKSSTTRDSQIDNTGAQTIQPDVSKQPRRRIGDNRRGKASSARPVENAQSVTEGRSEILNPLPDNRVRVSDAEVQRLVVESSLLPGDEAKRLSNYLNEQFESGYGETWVDRDKLTRAREVVSSAKETYQLKKQGVTKAQEAAIRQLFTDPVTGDILDSRVIRSTFAQQALSDTARAHLEQSNLAAALGDVYRNGSTPLIRAVAGRLSQLYLGDVKVKIESLNNAKSGSRVAGRWKNSTKELLLDPDIGLTEHTLIHEATHAATVEALRNAKTDVQQQAVFEMNQIFEKAKASLDENQYAFKNVAEFVAESFSNPELQFQLYQLKDASKTSLWQRFVNAVVKLVGLDTLLGKTFNVAEALLTAPVDNKLEFDSYALEIAAIKPDVVVKRTDEKYIFAFDNQAATLNFGKQVEKTLAASGIKIPASMNLAFQNVLKRSRAEATLRKWVDVHWEPIGTAVRNINAQYGKTLADTETFLTELEVLGRAEESIKQFDPLNTHYREQVNRAQTALARANNYLSDIENTNAVYFNAMIDLAKRVKASTDAVIDTRLAARNNMTPARAAELQTANANRYMLKGFYLPLQEGRPDSTEVAVMKRSLGQNFTAENPLSRVFAQAALTAYSNEENTQFQQVVALARSYNLTDELTSKPLIEIGPITKLRRDASGMIIEGQSDLKLDPQSVGGWIDDNYVRIKVADPALQRALAPLMKDAPIQAIATLMGVARYSTQMLSVLRTAANPAFALYNFLRDQGAVATQLNPKIKYSAYYAALLPATMSAFYNTFLGIVDKEQSSEYLEALDNGAFISQRSYVGLVDTIRDVRQDLEPTLAGRLKAGLTDPFGSSLGKVLTGIAQALETATRLAVYDAAIASGLTPREAAFHAKTTTTNFERKSTLTNTAGPFYMFINAKMQGIRTIGDKTIGIDANPRTQKAMGALVMLGLLAAAAGYENSEKDKDGLSKYAKIPDYKRDSMVIMKEGTPGVPLPQEAALFYVLGNAIGDTIWGHATTGETIARFLKNIIQQTAPLGAGQTDPAAKNTSIADYLMRLYVPSLSQPVYDLATNKDTFGREIVPTSLRFKSKQPYQKYGRTESPTSIAIAKYLHDGNITEVAPAQVSYMGRFLAGSAGTFFKDMVIPKPAVYEGQETNPFLKRYIASAAPFEDNNAYKSAYDDLKRTAESVKNLGFAERGAMYAKNEMAMQLLSRFKANEDFKTRTLFKNYDKMTDAQVSNASRIARDRMMALMREYYQMKHTQ